MSAVLYEFAALADAVQLTLLEAERLASTTSSKAAIYVQAARGNMRVALEAVTWRNTLSDGIGSGSGEVDLPELGIGLRIKDKQRAIGVRWSLGDDGAAVREDADFDLPAMKVRPSLAMAILASDELRRRGQGPVFGTLLANALATHEWIQPSTGTTWRPDPGAAGLLAEIVGGGRPIVDLPMSRTQGIVDAGVLAAIEGVGWRLFRPLELSKRAE